MLAHYSVKKAFILLSILVFAFVGVDSTKSFAWALDDQLGDGDEVRIRMELARAGVDERTRDALIAKLESGQVWDSMIPEATPVNSRQYQIGAMVETRLEYSDGSVVISSIEMAPELLSPDLAGSVSGLDPIPLAVTNCSSRSNGTVRTNTGCLVSHNAILVKMSFRADYTFNRIITSTYEPKTTWARIDRVHSPTVITIGSSAQSPTLNIIRKSASFSSPAQARLATIVTALGNVASGTVALNLYVPTGGPALAYTRFEG